MCRCGRRGSREMQAGARDIFNRLLPLINLSVLLETALLKEVLLRRGVFASTADAPTGRAPAR